MLVGRPEETDENSRGNRTLAGLNPPGGCNGSLLGIIPWSRVLNLWRWSFGKGRRFRGNGMKGELSDELGWLGSGENP